MGKYDNQYSLYGHGSRNSVNLFTIITIFIVIMAGVLSFAGIRDDFITSETVGTVIDKTVKRSSGKSEDFYLIYTRDAAGETQVLKIDDTWLHGNFDASDDYMDIEIGKTYNFKVQGERVPFLSWYPNIYEYAEIAVDD